METPTLRPVSTMPSGEVIIDRPHSYWKDDQQEHRWRDNRKHYAAIAEQDVLIDDLNCSLILSASNYRPRRPFQTVTSGQKKQSVSILLPRPTTRTVSVRIR